MDNLGKERDFDGSDEFWEEFAVENDIDEILTEEENSFLDALIENKEMLEKVTAVANVITLATLGIEKYVALCEQTDKDLYEFYKDEDEKDWNGIIRLIKCEVGLIQTYVEHKSALSHMPITRLHKMLIYLELAMDDKMFAKSCHEKCREIYYSIEK